MAVITISREYGSNGRDFARYLAKSLNYSYIDKDIYNRVAKKNNIPMEELQSLESITGLGIDFIQKFIDNDFIKRVVGKKNLTFENEEIIKFIENSIKEFAAMDNCIIVGRGAQCILQNSKNTFHIRLTKNYNDKILFLTEKGITENGAKTTIKRKDEERKNYIDTFYGKNWESPELYHIILNLSKVSYKQGVEIVKRLINVS